MEWAIVLPLGAFIALAALFAVVLHRAGRIVKRSREVEGFRYAVSDLTSRIEVSLAGATSRIDGVRRGQLGPEAIGETVLAAVDAVERYRDEARALHGPPAATAIRDGIVVELERAERALGMVEHGAGILAAVRRGGRELEAQTSIKRGYLNLLHAREAISAQAVRAVELERDARPRRDLLRPSQ
ncbi:MAG: hypothetical protein H0V74_02990 [Chloroflexi bacterium]|nr:hypothetical protein [Chloroflexota bacterium]